MMIQTQLSLFAKFPIAGFAKTRLISALGATGAAALHRHLASRTCALLAEADAQLTVHYTGADKTAFQDWLGEGLHYLPQPEGDLTERLMAAQIDGPQIFFGADTPDLSSAIIDQAINALKVTEVVIGPATDGGYYLIGMRKPLPILFADMEWSTDKVLPTTLQRLDTLGIAPTMLPILSDCDRPEDLDLWPELKKFAQS